MKKTMRPAKLHQFNIDKQTLLLLNNELQAESSTIVHCTYIADAKYVNGGWVNISANTILAKAGGYLDQLPLLHAVNIPFSPAKFYFENKGQVKKFILYFPAIPKDWTSFSMVEIIKGNNGFKVHNITKNNSGIYNLQIQ